MLQPLKIFPLFISFLTTAMAASHHPQVFLKSIQGKPDEGMQIVQHFCINCHGEKPLIALGAPRIGNVEDWRQRVKQDLNSLMQSVDEGKGNMPARGGCFECTDEQLKLAILAMLPEECKKDPQFIR